MFMHRLSILLQIYKILLLAYISGFLIIVKETEF